MSVVHWRGCPACGLVHRVPPVSLDQQARCSRCGSVILHAGRHRSASRTAALALAALVLYPLGILLPVLRIERLGHAHEASIWSGSVALLGGGHILIGLIVVVCSLLLPMAKLLGLLTICTGVIPLGSRRQAWLYHAIEIAGRFGMVDVLLVAALVAMVKLGDLVTIQPGPGVWAFTVMVLLSLLASASFDPHELWTERDA